MKINILFVDDDADALEFYKKLLGSMNGDWMQYYALSGNEALEIMQGNNIDVIVADLRMPQMDGVELLTTVKEKYPHVLRLVLSAHEDEMKAIRSIGVAHRFMLKPCDIQELKEKIQRSFQLRNYIQNDKVIAVINSIGELPTIPKIYHRIEEELRNPNSSSETIANIIAGDIGLVTKIMKIVNSSFFGFQGRITNLSQAIILLGLNILKALIIHYYIYSTSKTTPAQNRFIEELSEHSLLVANYAKKIAILEESDKLTIDDSFMSGILHDIGKLVLLNLPDYEADVGSCMVSGNLTFQEAEFEVYGFTHNEAGAYLLGLWGLPEILIEVALYHHEPSKLKSNHFTAVTAVHAANIFAKQPTDTLKKVTSSSMFNLFPKLDVSYLSNLNLKNNIIDWLK
ncbi:MAG: Response regulator [Ignavibacteria bacterium]|nr:Response regulator [Ignavibacteria bacterium]